MAALPKFGYKGKDFEFLSAPVRTLEQLKCPICLELVVEPIYTSCKHLFCGKCIKNQKNCPKCRTESFKTSPEVISTGVIEGFMVKCPNSTVGCEWKGELGDGYEHVQKKCDHEIDECSLGCGRELRRDLLKIHCKDYCQNRPFSCPHCACPGKYKDVISTHYADCEEFPLPCPAGCLEGGEGEGEGVAASAAGASLERGSDGAPLQGWPRPLCDTFASVRRLDEVPGILRLSRKRMKDHLSADCPEELVSCKYAKFGCVRAVRRGEREEHFADKEFHYEVFEDALTPMRESIEYFLKPTALPRPDLASLPLSFRPWLQNSPTCYPRPPWVVKLEGFEEKKQIEEEWFSEPICSHFGGYKMCLCVNSCGSGVGKSSHVSVYAHLMKGDNDDNLKFPFEGTMTVSLLNQEEDSNHHSKVLCTPKPQLPENGINRVTATERSDTGFGLSMFVSHEVLAYSSANKSAYLKSDSLFFRVDKFEHKFEPAQ